MISHSRTGCVAWSNAISGARLEATYSEISEVKLHRPKPRKNGIPPKRCHFSMGLAQAKLLGFRLMGADAKIGRFDPSKSTCRKSRVHTQYLVGFYTYTGEGLL